MYEWAKRMESVRKDKGLTRQQLADRAGLNLGQLNKAARGLVENPRGDFMQKVADVLGVTEFWLRYGEEPNAVMAPATMQPTPRHDMPLDVPVMGTGTGGHDGAINIDGAVDYLRRPSALANAKKVYAVFISGESMEPRYFAGEPVFVSPTRPISVGDHLVIQCRAPDGELFAFVKLVMGRTSKGWRVGQYNPVREWSPPFPVETTHRIYTPADLYLI